MGLARELVRLTERRAPEDRHRLLAHGILGVALQEAGKQGGGGGAAAGRAGNLPPGAWPRHP
jgi:hypothetical protein